MPHSHFDPFSGLPFSSPDRPHITILASLGFVLVAVVLVTRYSGASQPPTPIDATKPSSLTGVVFDSSTSSPLTGVRIELFRDASSGDASSGDASPGNTPSGDSLSGLSSPDSACGCSAMADIPSRVTTTDANGIYRFSSLAPGAYVLKASAPGYQSTTSAIRVQPTPSSSTPDPGQFKTTRINLYLSPDDSRSAGSDTSDSSTPDPSSISTPSATAEVEIANDLSRSVQSPRARTSAVGRTTNQSLTQGSPAQGSPAQGAPHQGPAHQGAPHNTESYDRLEDNPFYSPLDEPLSTFSIDVDAASYANIRRFLLGGDLPPKDAVRIEEMLNYFDYDYPQAAPVSDASASSGETSSETGLSPDGLSNRLKAKAPFPFNVSMRMGSAPWASRHRLLHIGIQGEKVPSADRPPSNLVFLLDVSGSMRSGKKLPLLKQSFSTLLEQLGPKDRVSIVVYAGASGLVLPSTPGSEKETIRRSIERLEAGGSTAGADGLRLAYDVARTNFIDGGNNRVILATDGDFNVGISSDAQMTRLIEEKRNSGVFLTTLGFGRGNLKDSKMEALAGHGNGNYYYIDSALEAKKVLSEEVGSTLHTIAKDVKLQIEFNPAHVQGYRLIGYVNRRLEDHQFSDDSTDAGELGAGHSVTALYEIVPTGVDPHVDIPRSDSLKYQSSSPGAASSDRDSAKRASAKRASAKRASAKRASANNQSRSDEWLTLKLRAKRPQSNTSEKMEIPFTPSVKSDTNAHTQRTDERTGVSSRDFTFAASVAAFGMILRDSPYKGSFTADDVLRLARSGDLTSSHTDQDRSRPPSSGPYRQGFIELVRAYRSIVSAEPHAHDSEAPTSAASNR